MREVGNLIITQFPLSFYVNRDIYNLRVEICRQHLNSRIITVVIIRDFNLKGILYKVLWVDLVKKEELVSLVFSYLTLLCMIKEFWELAYTDITYNTNVFRYPLF